MTYRWQLPEHIKVCIFDFDGTLAPNLDLPDMRRQVIALTQNCGVPPTVFTDHYIVEIIEVAERWLAKHDRIKADNYASQAQQLIRDIEMSAAQDTQPFVHTQPLLTQLRNNNIGTAIVTRNCEAAVRTVFPAVGECCDALFARDNVAFLKPDPRHVLTALDHLGEQAINAAMIGDGQMDMRLGQQLNMCCVGVLGGSSNQQTLQDAGADLIIEHIGQIRC